MEPPPPKRANLEEDEREDVEEEEMKFEYWDRLPLELRAMIAKKTDLITRFSLMYSSKCNYDIARSVPIKIESIIVGDRVSDDLEIDLHEPHTFIHLKKYDPSEIITTVCFSTHENGTLVRRFWKENDVVSAANTIILENVGYCEASMRFLEKLMTLTDYQMEEFEYNIKDWGEDLVFLDKLRIRKKLSMITTDGRIFNRWMNTAISPLEKLVVEISIHPNLSHPDQFNLNHETINNAKELNLSNFSDSLEKLDFLRLKCDKFKIYTPEVTGETVNEFIKKWINGDAPENFQSGSFSSGDLVVSDDTEYLAIRGIHYSEWQEEYRVGGDKELSELFDDDNAPQYPECNYIENKRRDNGAVLVFEFFLEGEAVFLIAGKQNLVLEENFYE